MKTIVFSSIEQRNQFLKNKALILSHDPYFVLLQTVQSLNEYYPDYEIIIGSARNSSQLSEADFNQKRWLLGGIAYTWKAQIEPKCPNLLNTSVPFPDIAFFEPEIIFYVKSQEPLKVYWEGSDLERNFINSKNTNLKFSKINLTFDEVTYKKKLQKIFEYLKRGDIYEVNFTIEYTIKELNILPLDFFHILTKNSPTPQAGILKWQNKWLICASQERFLKKKNNLLIAQPIKGTIQSLSLHDWRNAFYLFQSSKNRSENVMIVDLVRNDMNKVCEPGSVHVERLFQIQTYEFLHQMVSTIAGKPQKNLTNLKIIQSLFPAGSMTGCPKVRAMQIIEELEGSGRGIYAGSIGYFHQGNFDLNVVIRSLVWDEWNRLGSFHVGGAITNNSDWKKEFEECQTKARAILKSLGL